MRTRPATPRSSATDSQAASHTVTHVAMGTVMAHKAFGPCAEPCLAVVCREVERIEALLSRFRPDSEISRVNRSAGGAPIPVSLDTSEVLAQAAAFSAHMGPCLDVTIGPLVRVWQAAGETGATPDAAAIREALALVDYRDLLLDPVDVTAGLRRPGQSIDLGGIGKGFAADWLVDVYRRHGVESAFSNLGGNVIARGARPDGTPWRIGIQHPREAGLLGLVSVADRAVVTSGDYHRYYTDGSGARRHHILDPASGYPAESGLISVTIVARSALSADALSTVVYVTGLERGRDLLRGFDGVEAVLVAEDLRVYVTAGMAESFEPACNLSVTVLA